MLVGAEGYQVRAWVLEAQNLLKVIVPRKKLMRWWHQLEQDRLNKQADEDEKAFICQQNAFNDFLEFFNRKQRAVSTYSQYTPPKIHIPKFFPAQNVVLPTMIVTTRPLIPKLARIYVVNEDGRWWWWWRWWFWWCWWRVGIYYVIWICIDVVLFFAFSYYYISLIVLLFSESITLFGCFGMNRWTDEFCIIVLGDL